MRVARWYQMKHAAKTRVPLVICLQNCVCAPRTNLYSCRIHPVIYDDRFHYLLRSTEFLANITIIIRYYFCYVLQYYWEF
ncbi:hypothetical protein KIN20_029121 [Parelaphostrongylus tenuis]|uniref:Uncharacterized protein n=1 Tax=Parelaphostrongylus tenuis TaxID=148309 RepID=A0AAD5WFL8_PARTN|nr:hypothetical protein KIN20_029121 [Parelaphostrongylus tenuis]